MRQLHRDRGVVPVVGVGQPHAPSSETQVGVTTATTDYSYDADGNLPKTSGVNVTGVSTGGENVTWDDTTPRPRAS